MYQDPIGSMGLVYGIFTYIQVISMVNVGKYTNHMDTYMTELSPEGDSRNSSRFLSSKGSLGNLGNIKTYMRSYLFAKV